MSNKFAKPDFSKGYLELRYENNIVCIYGNKEGFKKLIGLCQELIDYPKQSHIHLENYQMLTKESEKGALAIF